MRLDAIVDEILRHALAELGVEIVCHAGGSHVHEKGVATVALERLGELDANVAGTYHGYGLDVWVLELVHDLLRVLEELDLLDVVQVAALEARQNRQGAGSEDELVVGLLICGAVLAGGIDDLCVEVDAVDGRFHVDGAALSFELFLCLIEEAARAADLVANPQGHAAAQEADV